MNEKTQEPIEQRREGWKMQRETGKEVASRTGMFCLQYCPEMYIEAAQTCRSADANWIFWIDRMVVLDSGWVQIFCRMGSMGGSVLSKKQLESGFQLKPDEMVEWMPR